MTATVFCAAMRNNKIHLCKRYNLVVFSDLYYLNNKKCAKPVMPCKAYKILSKNINC